MLSWQKIAFTLAILSAIPGLFYLLAWGMGSLAGFVTALLLAGLMPSGFWLGNKIARTSQAITTVTAFIVALSLVGIALHVIVAASNEPLGALALIVYLLPAQLAGLALMTITIVICNRKERKSA